MFNIVSNWAGINVWQIGITRDEENEKSRTSYRLEVQLAKSWRRNPMNNYFVFYRLRIKKRIKDEAIDLNSELNFEKVFEHEHVLNK